MEWVLLILISMNIIALMVCLWDLPAAECFVASVAALMLVYLFTVAVTLHSNNLIEECQQDLPRTELCVLIAVPESDAERTKQEGD